MYTTLLPILLLFHPPGLASISNNIAQCTSYNIVSADIAYLDWRHLQAFIALYIVRHVMVVMLCAASIDGTMVQCFIVCFWNPN